MELGRALYDGYNTPRATEPLQIKPRPPRREIQELMRLSMRDPATRVRIEQLQRQVLGGAGIRTDALRSAYEQLFAQAIKETSAVRRDRALRQVIEERNRYFANRIAQTELARAHADRVADEFLADETIEVVEVRMSPSHPVADICDLFARQDKYGLGPGLYPKLKAPKPTFHPFCRCRLVSRPDVSARLARERVAADRTFLRSLPVSDAARVMESRDRLQKVLHGADPLTLINDGRLDGYHVRLMEQSAASPSPATLPKRVPFRGDEQVGIVAEEAAVKKHPLYDDAKDGSIIAAASLVSGFMGDAWLASEGAKIRASGARLVGVHALEIGHINPIGAMMAEWVGYKLDMPVDRQIFQVNEVGHTGASGWHRLRSQALFAGSVEAGATYWLLDDFIGQGGTMANLRGWIESGSGRVAGYTAQPLAGQGRSAKLGLSAATLAKLRAKHGRLETWWRERFGFGFDSLTESEARYLIRAEDADTIRARLAED